VPEFFTFDNHDPKGNAPVVLSSPAATVSVFAENMGVRDSGGGCVLLNDGTVKFIRTEEEIQKLRWKR